MAKTRRDEDGDVRVTVKRGGTTEEMVFFRKVKSKTRPRLELTPAGAQYIETLTAVGCTIDEIVAELGVAKQTLYATHNRKFLDDAVEKGKARLHMSLRRQMVSTAMSGSVPMLIFLSKNYLGMSDNPQQEVVPVSPIPDFVDDLLADYEDDER